MAELQTLVTYECYGISVSAAIGYGSIAFGKVRSFDGYCPVRKLHNPAMMHRNVGNFHDAPSAIPLRILTKVFGLQVCWLSSDLLVSGSIISNSAAHVRAYV